MKDFNVNLSTFSDLINEIRSAKDRFDATGCFKSVRVTLDTSECHDLHSPNGYQVFFELDEKLLNLNTGTGIDTEKANPDMTMNFNMPNLFGRGESISIKLGREIRRYQKSRGMLPNVTAEFVKKSLSGKTQFSTMLKHDYVEKEWSNVSEEQMLGKASLQYNLTKHFNIRATGSSRLVNMLGLSSKPAPFVL